MLAWSWHRFRWEAERLNFAKFTRVWGDGTHLRQDSLVVEHALSSIDRITFFDDHTRARQRQMQKNPARRDVSRNMLIIPSTSSDIERRLRPPSQKECDQRQRAVQWCDIPGTQQRRGAVAFTAISLHCLERQQSGVSKSFEATKRECSEGSSGDHTMCKR